VKLRVRDVCHGDPVASRATVLQQKTQRPVQFEITASTREAVEAWIKAAALRGDDYLFPSRLHASPHLGTRQYARIVDGWAVQLLLGHTKLEITVRCLGTMRSRSLSKPKSDAACALAGSALR
jgi:integrase